MPRIIPSEIEYDKMGERLSNAAANVSIAASTAKIVAKLTLPPGSWVVVASSKFPSKSAYYSTAVSLNGDSPTDYWCNTGFDDGGGHVLRQNAVRLVVNTQNAEVGARIVCSSATTLSNVRVEAMRVK